MGTTKGVLFVTLNIIFLASACNLETPPLSPTSAVTQILGPASTPSGPLLTEAEVPRVSIEEAKAALEAGTAVFVDVRLPSAFEESHIPGAVNIPLEEIERNPTSLPLDKDRWIITYCT